MAKEMSQRRCLVIHEPQVEEYQIHCEKNARKHKFQSMSKKSENGKHYVKHIHELSLDILHASSTDELLAAVTIAKNLLYSSDESDDSVDLGVHEVFFTALFRRLSHLIYDDKHKNGLVYDDEVVQNVIGHIFTLLSWVYQRLAVERELSYHSCCYDILQLIWESFCIVTRKRESTQSYQIIKTLRLLSRDRSTSVAIVKQSHLLSMLVDILMIDDHISTSKGSKWEALTTLKNVAFYVDHDRLQMVRHPKLIDCLLVVCSLDADVTGRQIASAILRNLSMSIDCKIYLTEYPGLLNMIVHLLNSTDSRTKQNVLSTVISLALEVDNCLTLVTHGNGIIIRVIQQVVTRDEAPVVRRRAIRALSCFCRPETTDILLETSDVLECFCHVLIDSCFPEDHLHAIGALSCYALCPNIRDSHQVIIVQALIDAYCCCASTCKDAVIRTISILSTVENRRVPLLNHEGLLKVIISSLRDSESSGPSRVLASTALYNLSCAVGNRKKMAQDEVIAVLVRVGTEPGHDSDQIQSYVVKTIINLSMSVSSRNYTEILLCLIRYACSTADETIKNEAKSIAMNLIPYV